ncbi:MAG: tetratricopeptide repeat protein [Anaeromyxobacter sp.]
MKWLAPVLVAALAAVAGGTWWLLTAPPRIDPAVLRARQEGLAALALDDAQSLDRAAARLDAALKGAPNQDGIAADRALVEVVRAGGLLIDADGLRATAALRVADRDRLRAAAPPPAPQRPGAAPPPAPADPGAAAAAEADALAARAEALEARARSLRAGARQALDQLDPSGPGRQEIARARALLAAQEGNAAVLSQQAAAARAGGVEDGWVALAEAQPAHGEAATALASIASRHPDLLRARYLLARSQASLGRRAEALATLDALLAANPRHEGGTALRAELGCPVPGEPPPAAVAKPPPPARNPVAPAGATAAIPAREPTPAPASGQVTAPPGAVPAPAAVSAATSAADGAQPVPAVAIDPPRPAPHSGPVAAPVPEAEPVGNEIKQPNLDALP